MDNAERKYIDAEQLKDVLIISKNMISIKMQLFGDEDDAVITQAFNCGIDAALKAIDGLQTADVKPIKRGQWINEPIKGIQYHCSMCNGRFDYKWKYCPNCGCDMY